MLLNLVSESPWYFILYLRMYYRWMIDNEIQNMYYQMTCLNMDHKFRYAITSYPFQQDIR